MLQKPPYYTCLHFFFMLIHFPQTLPPQSPYTFHPNYLHHHDYYYFSFYWLLIWIHIKYTHYRVKCLKFRLETYKQTPTIVRIISSRSKNKIELWNRLSMYMHMFICMKIITKSERASERKRETWIILSNFRIFNKAWTIASISMSWICPYFLEEDRVREKRGKKKEK